MLPSNSPMMQKKYGINTHRSFYIGESYPRSYKTDTSVCKPVLSQGEKRRCWYQESGNNNRVPLFLSEQCLFALPSLRSFFLSFPPIDRLHSSSFASFPLLFHCFFRHSGSTTEKEKNREKEGVVESTGTDERAHDDPGWNSPTFAPRS